MRSGHLVLRLSGTPEEMGRAHGELMRNGIRRALDLYLEQRVFADKVGRERRAQYLAAARELRGALPGWFIRELDSCAAGAGVDPDLLLVAQCLDDLADVVAGRRLRAQGCTSYAAFGPATAGGRLEAARNLDYAAGEPLAGNCALVTYYEPAPGEGHRFIAVGWAGMLTGGTLVNEHGLIVANHIGGGAKMRPDGVPALILTRMIAQKAATVEEGLKILDATPRMRGQIIWMAQEGRDGRPSRAVAVEYDAQTVAVREAEDGVLIVTNSNRLLPEARGESELGCGRTNALRRLIEERRGRLDGSEALTLGEVFGNSLHVVRFRPAEGAIRVRHGVSPTAWAREVAHPLDWPAVGGALPPERSEQ
jgi:hypothetical protein